MNTIAPAAVTTGSVGDNGLLPETAPEAQTPGDTFVMLLNQRQGSVASTVASSPTAAATLDRGDKADTVRTQGEGSDDLAAMNLMAAYFFPIQPQLAPAQVALPEPQGLQPQGLQPQGLQPQGLQPQGLQPQGLQPQGLQPQGLQPQGLQPQGLQPQGLQPQGLQPQGLQPQGLQPQGLQPQGLQPQGLQVGEGVGEESPANAPDMQGIVLSPASVAPQLARETRPSILQGSESGLGGSAATVSLSDGQPRKEIAPAKIADHVAIPPPEVRQTSATAEKSTPLRQTVTVPTDDGMSTAMQHAFMPVVRPQPPKNTVIPMEAPASTPAQPVMGGTEVIKPVVTIFREQNSSNSGEDAPADGQVQFDGIAGLPATSDAATTRTTPGEVSTRVDNSTQEATAVLHHVMETAERMRSDGRSNVELQVHLHDGQELTIRLRLQGGEFHPVFKTESPELRTALEQSWSQFSSNSADRGMRISAPVFESSQSGMGDSSHRQDRQPQQQPQSGSLVRDEYQYFPPAKSRTAAAHPGVDKSIAERAGALTLFA